MLIAAHALALDCAVITANESEGTGGAKPEGVVRVKVYVVDSHTHGKKQ